MYNLGAQFRIQKENTISDSDSVIQGKKYRITVLTERLVRLEYNEEGIFNDLPTELVCNRKFPTPVFHVKQNKNLLQITTSYFKLSYLKEKPFVGSKINPMANLKIELLSSHRVWYYKHPEARCYPCPSFDLMNDTGKNNGRKGLYSLDGFASLDDSKTLVIEEDGTIRERDIASFDFYVFLYGNDFALALQDYFRLTGAPPLLPRYAFGNWWSRNYPYRQEEVQKLAISFEKNAIPLSVLLLEEDWHIRSYEKETKLTTGFTFHPAFFPNPGALIQFLHDKQIRLGLQVDPFPGFYPFESRYEEAKRYLGVNENGVIPFSVLDPKVIYTYFQLFIHPLDFLGVDFYFLNPFNQNDPSLWAFSHYHFYDKMKSANCRSMILTKNAKVASHRYPILYSGKTIVDWDTLKRVAFHNASSTHIGVSFWAHDIGGYYKGTEDNELYTRFVQLGTFSPILKFGSAGGKYYKREPWRWGVKTYEIVKNYLQLRHRMIPYLYTESYLYHKNGIPLIIPIYYKFPELYDDSFYRNEYYFGSQLFIAPIVSKKDYIMNRVIHRFFIPNGVWYDFVTGKKFPGNKSYISFFKDEEYPVFAKEGSILVLGQNESFNDTTPPKNMEIQVFPGESNFYTLYEDDGITDLYKQGFYIRTHIAYEHAVNNYTITMRAIEGKTGIIPKLRNYKFRFRNTKMAENTTVSINGMKAPFHSYVESTDFVVEVKNVDTTSLLTINCQGEDIAIDAVRIIHDDIESILSDLQIETELKEKVDAIIFSDLSIQKKRIAIRKLNHQGLEKKFIQLFLKLLDYIASM